MKKFCVVLLAVALLVVAAEAKTRKELCGSESDCVIIKAEGGGSVLKIDELDFQKDTVAMFLKKLPSWFGPRPAAFFRNGKRMNLDDTLASWQLPQSAQIDMKKDTAKGKDDL